MRLFAGTPFDRPVVCERCNQLDEFCMCLPQEEPRIRPEYQTARIAVEKRRKGKIVTVVRGLDPADLPDLLKQFKTACGAGGTIQDDVLEVQGDHRDRIRELLSALGFQIKG